MNNFIRELNNQVLYQYLKTRNIFCEQVLSNETPKNFNYIINNFFLFFPACIYAQTQGTGLLFLNQAISSAIRSNPDIQVQRGKISVMGQEVLSSAIELNPFFLFDTQPSEDVYEFGLQKPFETGRPGKIRKKIRDMRVELEKAELSAQVINLEDRVIDAYTQVFINQERIKVLKDSLDFILHSNEYTESLSEVEQLLAEGEIINITQNLEDSKIEVEKARLVLEELVGEEIRSQTNLGNPRELKIKEGLNEEKLIQIALRKKPEIIENEKELELEKLLKALAKSNLWPLIIAAAGTRLDFKNERYGVFISLDIELPILGLEKRQINAAELRIEQVMKARKTIIKNTKLEVSENYKLYEFTKQRLLDYEEKYLPKMQNLIDTVREKYLQEEVHFIDLLKAEKARILIMGNYFDALIDYENAFSDLERSVGVSLVGKDGKSSVPGLKETITPF